MTIWTFLYIIGSGVALIMGYLGLSEVHRELPEEQKCIGGLVCSCIFCFLLSWAIPIWYVGFEVYKRFKREK